MAEVSDKIISTLETRIRQLMFICENLEEKNLLLLKEIEEKDAELKQLEEEKAELYSRYVNLKVAKVFTSDNEEIKEGKARFNKLVREIDKCIALLNE